MRKVASDESGRVLVWALFMLGLGVLLLPPFLARINTNLLTARAIEEGMKDLYAADAGVEHAMWRMKYDQDFMDSLAISTTVSYTLTINDRPVLVTVTQPLTTTTPITSTCNIYAFQGDGNKAFWRYSISGGSWETLTDAPGNVKAGGALAYDGSSYIYAFQGDRNKAFWRYSISGGSWETLTDAPSNVKDGGALAYDGSSYIHAFQGDGNKAFWRYNVSGGSWETLTDAPGNVKNGGALVYVGGDCN